MERRFADRKRTTTKVFLHHPDLPSTPCLTRNMSKGGVFVEVEGALNIQRGTRLEMTFAVDLGNLTKLHQLQVVVAQVARDGLGLSIERLLPERSTTIRGQINSGKDCEVLPLRGQRSSQRKPYPVV